MQKKKKSKNWNCKVLTHTYINYILFLCPLLVNTFLKGNSPGNLSGDMKYGKNCPFSNSWYGWELLLKFSVASLKTKPDKYTPKCEAKEQEAENAGFLTTSLCLPTKADTAQGTTAATMGLEWPMPTSACISLIAFSSFPSYEYMTVSQKRPFQPQSSKQKAEKKGLVLGLPQAGIWG